jgi:dihydrofolate reductase
VAVSWQNSTLVDGDVADELMKLKHLPGGDISITGSPTLVRPLLFGAELDDLRLLVHPVVVGPGKRLFDHATAPVPLKLIDERRLSTGVLYAAYGLAG